MHLLDRLCFFQLENLEKNIYFNMLEPAEINGELRVCFYNKTPIHKYYSYVIDSLSAWPNRFPVMLLNIVKWSVLNDT